MRERMGLNGGGRGHAHARASVAMGLVVVGVATTVAMLGGAQPVRAQIAAPPPQAGEALPTCQPLFMNAALEQQFKDIAPGVPYQAGGDPVQKIGRPEGRDAIIHMVIDQMGFIRGMAHHENLHATNRLRFCGSGELVENGHTYQVTTYQYGISLHRDAARADIQAEGLGDKGRVIRVVLGNEAWDESAPGVGTHSADHQARERQLQLQADA